MFLPLHSPSLSKLSSCMPYEVRKELCTLHEAFVNDDDAASTRQQISMRRRRSARELMPSHAQASPFPSPALHAGRLLKPSALMLPLRYTHRGFVVTLEETLFSPLARRSTESVLRDAAACLLGNPFAGRFFRDTPPRGSPRRLCAQRDMFPCCWSRARWRCRCDQLAGCSVTCDGVGAVAAAALTVSLLSARHQAGATAIAKPRLNATTATVANAKSPCIGNSATTRTSSTCFFPPRSAAHRQRPVRRRATARRAKRCTRVCRTAAGTRFGGESCTPAGWIPAQRGVNCTFFLDASGHVLRLRLCAPCRGHTTHGLVDYATAAGAERLPLRGGEQLGSSSLRIGRAEQPTQQNNQQQVISSCR
ncbi:hypothetical protein DQ04_11011020 [Trypanosoma grayi]|uniref:hypothetical protein n=1 Tax=Trypanosoma grayi TaxID=71804 RepID=UPI0004F4237F|nr:hypothetical protein DQ04_11011020 [Trypanosoma grayi]KEG07075.1 hypothetical protein DQ04_11011020 [Trypanosoma grayi]